MNRLFIILVSFVFPFILFAGSNSTNDISVGEHITVHATFHSNTQSVLWHWDSSVMELQGNLYEASSSATFIAIKSTSLSGTVIQATTYYYKNGTTSSGINKDVDTWKYVVSEGNSNGSSGIDCGVYLSRTYFNLGVDERVSLTAYPDDNCYDGGYAWSSSNPSVVTFVKEGNNRINVRAESMGTAIIRVSLDNGRSASCSISVTDDDNKRQLNYELNADNQSYSVSFNNDAIYVRKDCVIPATHNDKPVTKIANSGFSNLYFLESITIPNTIEAIGTCAFAGCEGLKSINLPNSVNFIGIGAFQFCDQLQTITMPNDITSIPNFLFWNCKSLKSVRIPDKVKTMGKYAFEGCDNLTYITIPAAVDTIYEYSFKICPNLKNIIFEGGENPIHLMDYAFSNVKTLYIGRPINKHSTKTTCWGSDLTNVIFEDDITEIEAKLFEGCNSLVSVHLPNSLKIIPTRCFGDCKNLRDITLPDSLIRIDGDSFNGCHNIGNMAFPNSLKEIGARAFFYAGKNTLSLTTLQLPSGLEILCSQAFLGYGHLKEIYYNTETPCEGYGYGITCFSEEVYDDAILYIPYGRRDVFDNTIPWKYFKNKQEYFQSAVNEIELDEDITEVARYDTFGNRVGQDYKGLTILLFSNGSVKKTFFR